MRVHELKCWGKYFNELSSGKKKFELRKNDRNFKVGDHLCIQAYDPEKKEYTGGFLYFIVTYILNIGEFLEGHDDWVVMGIKRLSFSSSED